MSWLDEHDYTVWGRCPKCDGTGQLPSRIPPCSICERPWEEHYEPDMLKYKGGPFGVFGLKDGDHTPHISGIHLERTES